jgi:hypothetical protein
VTLSAAGYPDGVTDEAQYGDYVGERTEALIDAARQASDGPTTIERHLAVANWILARQIEPQITRLLLGIDEPADKRALAASVAQAQEWLTTAGELLTDLPADTAATQPTSDDGQVGRVNRPDTSSSVMSGLWTRPTELNGLHADLSAFAEAMGAVTMDTAADEAPQRIRRSASRLGVLLEDTRPGVSAAAALYQAMLFARIDRMDRAMTRLDLVLLPPQPDAVAPCFFGRLLRCRFLARQGAYAVAWSLLLRLEERCQEWFDTPQAKLEATNSVAIVRLEVARAWNEAMTDAGADDRSAWCQAAERRVRESLFASEEAPRIMRMEQAIPVLTDLIDADGAPTERAGQ